MEIVGVGQISLTDLNDAIISGSAPVNPTISSLWIDDSGTGNPILKRWDGSGWVPLGELDPDLEERFEFIDSTLGNMANDNILDFGERSIIKDRIIEIIGYRLADTITTLPTVATLDANSRGSFYSARKLATNAKVSTTHASYVGVATSYNSLRIYLEGMTPIKPWNLASASKDITISVNKLTFVNTWLAYYKALETLSEYTSQVLKENAEEAERNAKSYTDAEMTPIKERVSTAESKITATAITNTVTSSTTYTTDKTTADNKAKGYADSAKSHADTAVANIEIGGRNLIIPSNVIYRLNNGTIVVDDYNLTSVSNSGEIAGYLVEVTPSTQYTVSYEANDPFGIRILEYSQEPIDVLTYDNQLTGIANKTTFITGSNTTYIVVGVYGLSFPVYPKNFDEWKLEKGNKATDWTPAPEDVESDAAAKAEAARLAAISTASGDATTKANNAKSQAISTASSDATSKANSAKSYTDAEMTPIKGRVSTAESTITQHANEIDLKVDKDGVIAAINVSSESVDISANKINFDGHVFGTNATFTGDIEGSTITGSEFVMKYLDENENWEFRGRTRYKGTSLQMYKPDYDNREEQFTSNLTPDTLTFTSRNNMNGIYEEQEYNSLYISANETLRIASDSDYVYKDSGKNLIFDVAEVNFLYDVNVDGNITAGGIHVGGDAYINNINIANAHNTPPSGNGDSLAYWKNLKHGTYMVSPNTITNQPSTYGIMYVTKAKENSDFNVIWYPQSRGDIFRLSGNATTLHPWIRLTSYYTTNLWAGAVYMNEATTIIPSVKLSECSSGWVLNWSDYSGGGNRYDNIQTFVHKSHLDDRSGQGLHCIVSGGASWTYTQLVSKYVYIHDDKIEGNAVNQDNTVQKNIALTKVEMF